MSEPGDPQTSSPAPLESADQSRLRPCQQYEQHADLADPHAPVRPGWLIDRHTDSSFGPHAHRHPASSVMTAGLLNSRSADGAFGRAASLIWMSRRHIPHAVPARGPSCGLELPYPATTNVMFHIWNSHAGIPNMESAGVSVRAWLAAAGLNAPAVARRAGVSGSTVHRILNDAVDPSIWTLHEIAVACGIDIDLARGHWARSNLKQLVRCREPEELQRKI
jgi:hypothetical protein